MKKAIMMTAVLLTACIFTLKAQNEYEELVVPLTDPSKPGLLRVGLMNGSMKVTGYSGKEVVIRVSTDQRKVEEKTRNGLKRIPNRSLGLTAIEEDNYVKISSNVSNKEISLLIQVPKNFNLKLSGHNDGNIIVENVNGELDVSHHNDDVTLIDVSGSAIVNTHNGDIKVRFVTVTPNTPMAFTTFNGDVDVTFPASLKASVKMQSERGEMYTDFNMAIKTSQPKREDNRDGGVYKISLQEWTRGDINGGGPEMLFKTYNGDIIIRKK